MMHYTLTFFIEKKSMPFSKISYLDFIIKSFNKKLNSNANALMQKMQDLAIKKSLGAQSFLAPLLKVHQGKKLQKKLPAKQEDNIEEEGAMHDVNEGFIFVSNAGLILLWPFLAFYFERLGLTVDNKFTSKDKSSRAAGLLYFLTTGDKKIKEHEMTLNKIICGLPPGFPLSIAKQIKKEDELLSLDLLKTAISRWEIIKGTSIEGFRESFLQRNGELILNEEETILHVEKKAFDMLIDKLPWSISTIRLPWLDKPIIVNWR